MDRLNLGILAHVDAGKTTLTERLLFNAGVIDKIGTVDDGSTQTDTLRLERARGITIKSAVVSFPIAGVAVNLIDTPGHPDFIAEVERVLDVLDGAVLVVSAVEGVQPQTRILWRTLERLGIPTLFFVNKIDRSGADPERVVAQIRRTLTDSAIAIGKVERTGTKAATFRPFGPTDDGFATELADVLAQHDDSVLEAFIRDGSVPFDRLRAGLVRQARDGLVHPVFYGAAATGAGVEDLSAGIAELLPRAPGDPDAPLSATIFKVDRGPAGERIAFVRVFDGSIRLRDQVETGRVTGLAVFEGSAAVRTERVGAGQIGRAWGLGGARIGDWLGEATRSTPKQFSPPTLETLVVARSRAEKPRLLEALTRLAEQDPLIDLRQDDVRGEVYLSLYGEVQKEVIADTLAVDFGLEVQFRETTTIYVERPERQGAAIERMGEPSNPFLATVGLCIEPGPPGSGPVFRLGSTSLGQMTLAFYKAVEETVYRSLRQGLYGWQVTDLVVTMTDADYAPRQSHAHQGFNKAFSSTGADFRDLTPLVVIEALRRAGSVVHEPIHRFRLDVPADTLGPVLSLLARSGCGALTQSVSGGAAVVEGELPAARVHELRRQLPGSTRGEAVFDSTFDSYRPVRGEPPRRSRTDRNPLDRREYLLRVKGVV